MEPFLVACETCRAKLKVRDERILGQIHECPKCGSMVHIVQPTSVAVMAAVAVTMPKASPIHQVPVNLPTAEPISPTASLVEPSFAARLTHVAREHGWLALAGGMSLVVVGGLIAALVRSGPDQVSTPDYPSMIQPETVSENASIEPAASIVAASSIPTTTKKSNEPESPVTNATQSHDVEVRDASDATPAPPEPITSSSEPPSPFAKTPATSRNTSGSTTVNGDSTVPPDEQRKLTLEPVVVAAPPAAPSNATALAYSAAAALTEVESPTAKPQAAVVPSGVIDRERERAAANVSTQLSLPIRAIDLPDMPLGDFVRMISEMGAIPVALDADALAAAGATTRSKVAVRARDATLGAVLSDALKPLGLAWVERDGKLVVVRTQN